MNLTQNSDFFVDVLKKAFTKRLRRYIKIKAKKSEKNEIRYKR